MGDQGTCLTFVEQREMSVKPIVQMIGALRIADENTQPNRAGLAVGSSYAPIHLPCRTCGANKKGPFKKAPVVVKRRQVFQNLKCANCRIDHGRPMRGFQDGSGVILCRACHTYYRRYKMPRPEDLWYEPVRSRNRTSAVPQMGKVMISPVRRQNGRSPVPRTNKMATYVDACIQTDDGPKTQSAVDLRPSMSPELTGEPFQLLASISPVNTGNEGTNVSDMWRQLIFDFVAAGLPAEGSTFQPPQSISPINTGTEEMDMPDCEIVSELDDPFVCDIQLQ